MENRKLEHYQQQNAKVLAVLFLAVAILLVMTVTNLFLVARLYDRQSDLKALQAVHGYEYTNTKEMASSTARAGYGG